MLLKPGGGLWAIMGDHLTSSDGPTVLLRSLKHAMETAPDSELTEDMVFTPVSKRSSKERAAFPSVPLSTSCWEHLVPSRECVGPKVLMVYETAALIGGYTIEAPVVYRWCGERGTSVSMLCHRSQLSLRVG